MRDEIAVLATKALGAAALESPSISYWQSTGSLLFDQMVRGWEYKEGGIPGGKFTELYGQPGAGKTAFAMRVAKQVQESGGLVVFINTSEQGFNPEWATKIGVNTESPNGWILANAFALESCFQFIEDVVLEHYTTDYPVLIIIDSLSGLGCMDYSMDKSTVIANVPAASGAKFLHQWFRRGALYYLSGSRISIIAIRHLTASPRPFSPETTTHGSALNFYAWLRIKMRREDMADSDTGARTGMWLHLKITKSKIGPPFQEMQMPLYCDRGFDEGLEVIWHLLAIGALEKDKNHRIDWCGTNLYVRELCKQYHENSKVRQGLRELVLATAGIQQKKKKKAGKVV